jgi:G3E family GTPase
VVVNDVAAVNIDAKLIRERSSSGIQTKSGDGVEFVELENGCACCNASGELLACVEQLLEIASVRGHSYDRIIIEMSGVGEPRNVRAEFHEALREGHPIFDKIQLCTMITVVDSPHFFRLYRSLFPPFSCLVSPCLGLLTRTHVHGTSLQSCEASIRRRSWETSYGLAAPCQFGLFSPVF